MEKRNQKIFTDRFVHGIHARLAIVIKTTKHSEGVLDRALIGINPVNT
jgi:hypothetical protein